MNVTAGSYGVVPITCQNIGEGAHSLPINSASFTPEQMTSLEIYGISALESAIRCESVSKRVTQYLRITPRVFANDYGAYFTGY